LGPRGPRRVDYILPQLEAEESLYCPLIPFSPNFALSYPTQYTEPSLVILFVNNICMEATPSPAERSRDVHFY
jgi:hypothetical protein